MELAEISPCPTPTMMLISGRENFQSPDRFSPEVPSKITPSASMSKSAADPLAGLDSVNWSRLTHAYGPADDVPELLGELTSTDPEVYFTAFDVLLSTIYHQGSRYSASAEAIPFLYSLVSRKTTQNRESLLYLITSLAVGHPDWSVPKGVDVAKWQKRISETLEPSCEFHEFNTYEAAERGLPCIIDLLEDESPKMRAMAAHALAFFPRESEASVEALLGLLGRETDSAVRGTIVLAIAIMFVPAADQRSRKSDIIRRLQDYYYNEAHRGDIFQWSSATALTILGAAEKGPVEETRRVLKDEAYLSHLEASIGPDSGFPFAMLDLRTLAKAALADAGGHSIGV